MFRCDEMILMQPSNLGGVKGVHTGIVTQSSGDGLATLPCRLSRTKTLYRTSSANKREVYCVYFWAGGNQQQSTAKFRPLSNSL